MTKKPTKGDLQKEVLTLLEHVRCCQEGIARINQADGDNGHFQNMAEQLDAIVETTETATDGILVNLETIGNVTDSLRSAGKESEADKIDAAITSAMEACTFQDITGQRVGKIRRSIQFAEERVSAMADAIGRDEIVKIANSMDDTKLGKELEDALLKGPVLEGDGVSQDEMILPL